MSQLIRVKDAAECCEQGQRYGRATFRTVFLALWEAYDTAKRVLEANALSGVIGAARAAAGVKALPKTLEVNLGQSGTLTVSFLFTERDSFGDLPDQGQVLAMINEAFVQAQKITKKEVEQCMKKKALPQNSARKYGVKRGMFRV